MGLRGGRKLCVAIPGNKEIAVEVEMFFGRELARISASDPPSVSRGIYARPEAAIACPFIDSEGGSPVPRLGIRRSSRAMSKQARTSIKAFMTGLLAQIPPSIMT